MRKENGAITLEAAIALTATMAVVLTLSLFARIAYTQGVVQHALTQTCNELAIYSYFYSATGLSQVNNALTGEQASEEVSGLIDGVEDTLSSFQGGDISKTLSGAADLKDAYSEAGGISGIIKSLVKAMTGEVASEVKTRLLNVATTALMKTYLPENMERFNKMCMFVDKDDVYVKNDKFPLYLEYSTYFDNSAGDEIHLVAVYKIKPTAPIPILSKPITIVQNAKARAWMSSWDTSVSSKSVWDLPDGERAKKIASTNSALNLRSNFKAIRGFSSGKASMFITIDIRKDSYTGNKSAIKSKIKSKITALSNFDSDVNDGTTITSKDIKTVDYYVYIPSGASDSDKQYVKDIATELSSSVTLKGGNSVKPNIIVKEVD